MNQKATMPHTKTIKISASLPVKSKSINLRLNPKLQERAVKYADLTGLSVPALLRNGLDLLLKQNNF